MPNGVYKLVNPWQWEVSLGQALLRLVKFTHILQFSFAFFTKTTFANHLE